MPQPRRWNDVRSEQVIGNLLRSGVIISGCVVFLGGILYLLKYGSAARNFAVFQGEPTDLRHISGILKDTSAFHSRGIIQLGLILLIATPVARVVFSIASFALERDWLYVSVTCVVLALLVYSMAGGRFF